MFKSLLQSFHKFSTGCNAIAIESAFIWQFFICFLRFFDEFLSCTGRLESIPIIKKLVLIEICMHSACKLFTFCYVVDSFLLVEQHHQRPWKTIYVAESCETMCQCNVKCHGTFDLHSYENEHLSHLDASKREWFHSYPSTYCQIVVTESIFKQKGQISYIAYVAAISPFQAKFFHIHKIIMNHRTKIKISCEMEYIPQLIQLIHLNWDTFRWYSEKTSELPYWIPMMLLQQPDKTRFNALFERLFSTKIKQFLKTMP